MSKYYEIDLKTLARALDTSDAILAAIGALAEDTQDFKRLWAAPSKEEAVRIIAMAFRNAPCETKLLWDNLVVYRPL